MQIIGSPTPATQETFAKAPFPTVDIPGPWSRPPPPPDPAKLDASARVPHQKMPGHTNTVECILRLPGGQRIITGSWDGSLRVWDLERATQVGKEWKDQETEEVRCQVMTVGPDGKRVESSEGVWAMALSPDGKTVASGGLYGTVRLWDIDSGKVIKKWTGNITVMVKCVCWSPDGRRVVSGFMDGSLRVWDVKSGKIILVPIHAGDIVWTICYSPDGTMIVTSADSLKVWDANTGGLLKTLEKWGVSCLAWTSDEKTLIASSLTNKITLFDTATWTEIAVLDGGYGPSISLSPNECILTSVSGAGNTAQLWNLKTNQPIGPALYHEKMVGCATFSADGRFLVTGCGDYHVHTWDVSFIIKEAGLDDLLSDNVSSTTLLTDIRSSQNTANNSKITFMKRLRDLLRYYLP